ncbi:phage antirepressor [Actinomadura sp. HBU206391]|uniref:phage antirepressor n=1 Tax=Actinomadura sp. HBU206391 TaxID=2731692 RepID=UPI001C9C76A7|nr:phage antirepressor [Actinomadura sp. HBU206391]
MGGSLPTSVQPFRFPITDQPIRTVLVDGEPWFVAADVCAILAIGNPSQAVSYLDDDERDTTLISSEGGQQRPVNIINESDLYSLILRSRKPEARAFKRWITAEVLPAIRRTGGYATTGFQIPRSFAEALELAAQQARELETSRNTIQELEPAAAAWDVLASATGDYSLREAAHILNRDPAISSGQNRLMRSLRALGMVDRRGIPYAKHSAHLVERTTSYEHPRTKEPKLSTQIRITVQGLRYLHKRLGGTSPLDLDGEA